MRSNGRRGAAGQQYAIVVGLIGVVALLAINQVGGSIRQLFTNTANTLQTVATNGAISLPQGSGGSTAPANQPPVAGPVTLTGTSGAAATYSAAAVMANASDPEGAALTLIAVGAPSSGTVSLSGGSVIFSPTGSGSQSFGYTVSDGSLTATGTATVTVSAGSSCKALKTADASLSGIVVKTIRPGSSDISALCNFTDLGGGWTLVAIQYEADPIAWDEGRQSDYDPSLAAGRSFALTSDIPTHTHTAFGRAINTSGAYTTAMVDSIPLVYSTGDLHPRASYASDSTSGANYWIHRKTNFYYGSHDPDNTGSTGNTTIWNNTLTFNRNDGSAASHNWAFSPQHGTQNQRGYAYAGSALFGSFETYGWAVWVR